MKALVAALCLVWPAIPALAEDVTSLTAEGFEALVEGKTMDTHDGTGLYGVETFLPGRRAIWRDADQCLEGTWRVQGDQICYDYQGDPFTYCWIYEVRDGVLTGWYEGDRSNDPIRLYPANDVVTCEGFLGA